MSAPLRVPGRKRGIALVLLAVMVVAGSVAAGELTESIQLEPPSPEPVPPATTGTAYCPVTAAEGEGAALVLAAPGEQDSEVVISRYSDGVASSEEVRLLPAGTSVTLGVPAEQLTEAVTIDWRGGPLLAHYEKTDGQEVLAAPCATAPAEQWHLAGFDTSLGSTSLLHLFNPFAQDALVTLAFGTPEGPVELVIADELLVPARSASVLNLAQFRPETADLAVTITTDAGRVIPQGQVDLAPPAEDVEGVTGRALIPAAASSSEVVVIPEGTSDQLTQAWVSVYNPQARSAAVQVEVSTPLADASTLASEITVPAGGTTRISLEELSALPRFGVQLTSVNGVGITATRVAAVTDVQRTGVSVALGAPVTAQEWAVAGSIGTASTLTVFNPGAEPATAAVDIAGGVPETWTAITIPPNGLTALPVAQAQAEPQGPAIVSADLPVVAGVVNLRPESDTAYWSATGVAMAELEGVAEALPPRRDPALSSMPATSATATPTPTAVEEEGRPEGGLGQPTPAETVTTVPIPSIEPPVVPTDAATPTPAPTGPSAPTPTPTPTGGPSPPPSPTASPTSSPSPLPSGTPVEEGSLFGKVRVASRRRRPDWSRRPGRCGGPGRWRPGRLPGSRP